MDFHVYCIFSDLAADVFNRILVILSGLVSKQSAAVVAVDVWNADCESCVNVDTLSERGTRTLGPARRIAENPFLIVVGQYLHLLLSLLAQH